MNVVLPRDVRDLKIQIGIDILETGMRAIGAHSQIHLVLSRANDEDHIEAAEKWREELSEPFHELGVAADRAIMELPGGTDSALLSLMSDFHYNYPRMVDVLSRSPYNYISKLIGKIAGQDEEEMRFTLQALSSFGGGE